MPLEWSAEDFQLGEQELLQHFQHAASRSLAIIGHDPAELGDALIRIALAGNTPSAGALLKSILAFSSLHRHDVHAQAVDLKISALAALGAVTRANDSQLDMIEAMQHVAAGMLLSSFEVKKLSPRPKTQAICCC